MKMVKRMGVRKRVLVLTTSYPSDAADASGHFVRAEAVARARNGDDVTVMAPAPVADDGVETIALSGSSLFRWPGAVERLRANPLRALATVPFALNAFAKLRGRAFDEIVAHWVVPSAMPLAAFASAATMEAVCHGADIRLLCSLPAYATNAVVKALTARNVRWRFVATTLRLKLLRALDERLADKVLAQSAIVAPRVDVEAKVPICAQEPFAIFIGRLVPTKRVWVAVRAAQAAELPLVVVGDGPELERLRRTSMRGVRVLGRLGRPQTLGWLERAKVLLHPSAVDAAPTSVLEARALGVPVLSSGAGDVPLWARSDPGIQVATDDHAFFEATQRFAR